MRISDWSSDVCSSDLRGAAQPVARARQGVDIERAGAGDRWRRGARSVAQGDRGPAFLDQRAKPAPAHNEPQAIALDVVFEAEHLIVIDKPAGLRSEERRVGRECVRTCRYRW